MIRSARRTRLVRGIIVVWLLADVALLAYCGVSLRRSADLDVELVAGDDDCAWRLVVADDEDGDGSPCVESVAGVELAGPSLVREPTYLGNLDDFQRWQRDQRALRAALANRDRTEVSLVLAGGDRQARSVAVTRPALGPLVGQIVTAMLVAFALLGIGTFVVLRRPGQLAARSLFAFCEAVFVCNVISVVNGMRGVTFPAVAERTLYELNLAFALVAAGAAVHLAATFPAPQLGGHTRRIALLGPLALGVAALAAEHLGAFGAVPGAAFAMVLGAVALLVVAQIRPLRPVQRLQARWVMWGLGALLIVVLLLRAPVALGLIEAKDPSDILLVLPVLPLPIGIGVAILRHRLLDIEVVIRRTILGAGVTLVVLFGYNLAVSTFASGLTESGGAAGQGLTAILITAIVLTFLLVPAQTRLEALLDRTFFRNRYHYRRVLAQIPNDLAGLDAPNDVAEAVLSRVGAAMESHGVVVALAPGLSGARHWSRVSGGAGSSREMPSAGALRPPEDGEFWAQVKRIQNVHFCSSEETAGILDHWLLSSGLELLLPLHTDDELVGLFASTGLPGGALLSAEDVELLRTVASSLALALSRTLAYETIRRMNEELEERIEERTTQLEQTRLQLYQWEKMASLGVLAAGVAHELNTPLGVVLSSADQLSTLAQRREASPDRLERLTKLCLDGARRATDIVQNLRAFSKPESQDLQVVDLHEMLDSTLRLMEPTLRSRGIAVIQDRGDVVPIEGYPVLMNQLLTNLMLNAASAVEQDGEIRVSTERRGNDRLALVVEDNGPGVADEIRGRIFEPFFTTRPPGEGTGLGLSLCYTFVEQHGGRIWEEGKPGEGARFVVELPLRHPPQLREQRIKDTTPDV